MIKGYDSSYDKKDIFKNEISARIKKWSRRGLNPRPSVHKTNALTATLRDHSILFWIGAFECKIVTDYFPVFYVIHFKQSFHPNPNYHSEFKWIFLLKLINSSYKSSFISTNFISPFLLIIHINFIKTNYGLSPKIV